jgi:hypothetical protein
VIQRIPKLVGRRGIQSGPDRLAEPVKQSELQ